VNLSKNHNFEKFSFQELVNSGQQLLTKVALMKNMRSQLSKSVSEVILSSSEHFLFFLKITSFLVVFLKIQQIMKFHHNFENSQKVDLKPLWR